MKERIEFEPLLSPAEAAGVLGVDVKTLTRYARERGLPAKKTAGGHRRYRREDLEKFQLAAEGPRHQPYPHPGAFLACHACSKAAGEPVAWESCGAR